MTTIQYVMAVALALIVFVAMANLMVDLYARGVVRAAVDEGSRVGARLAHGVRACEARAADVLDGLLDGALRAHVAVSCEVVGDAVVARGDATLPSWVPWLVPPWELRVVARTVAEREP